ncbi:peptidoglycan DD-metalloendopeptidase family protein [uncultured Castellaniella sp.]|uniref:murein hydrolase activator EnvC family protein n=1 Tax=uncultured Castellaniella sp. TaxID=647907 RepID=UPI002633AA48|nr:peptidoglycan DD-metalloendopeptidase family protein [uncultured Castellaniella sp.]
MRHVGLGLLLCLAAVCAQAQSSLQTRQTQAREDRQALREQIDALQKRIGATESARQDATVALKDSEQAISDISRKLADLDQRHKALTETLQRLQAARQQQTAEFDRQRKALADQLRAQYASGLSPWTALLSGRDPQEIGRELAYLAYVSRARTKDLKALQDTVARLSELQRQTDASQKELAALVEDTQAQKQALQTQQAQRQDVLAQVQSRLKDEHRQAKDLQARDGRLGNLIQSLDVEIARAEARRQAALKAAAERRAKERAEQARREQQRLKAQREQAAREAQQVREQAERHVRESAGQGLSAEEQAATPASARSEPPASSPAEDEVRAVPDKGFAGLHKNLIRPVSGEVQGRFGMQRPEGGVWRGIVLRAAVGTPVRAVASGRVVYAHWLSGFGNLLIIDHGQQYLSIYGYNQALLKQVGDVVSAGDVVARVGATGGQVEPGLYFELRHQGAPINPQLWLRP